MHEINRNRRDLLSVYNDQDNEFDNIRLIHLDSTTVNTDPSSDNELANKKCVDGSIGQGIVLRFNQTLQNYLKVSVGNDTYNLTKYDKIQITDTTIIKSANTGGYLLEQRNIKSNGKNIVVENKTSQNQQEQTVHHLTVDQLLYLLSVIVLCTSGQVLIIMVIMFLSASNEQILIKLVI